MKLLMSLYLAAILQAPSRGWTTDLTPGLMGCALGRRRDRVSGRPPSRPHSGASVQCANLRAARKALRDRGSSVHIFADRNQTGASH